MAFLDNVYKVKYYDDVEVSKGTWKRVTELVIGDKILNSEGFYDTVVNVENIDDTVYRIYVK